MSKKEIAEILKDPTEYANNLEISKLVKLLQKLSDAYYSDIEIVDDSIYDKLEAVLKKRDQDNKFLFQTGVSNKDKTDVELPYTMPSLNKIKPKEKELKKWFKKYEGSYIIMDKLDGISVQLHKNNKGQIELYTKKQTNIGTSKKYLIEHLINKKALDKMPNNTSIRGEVVISKKDFEPFKDEFKNPRSVVAGLMNTDKIDNRIAKVAKYIVYDILSHKEKIKNKLKKLEDWGFDTVWNCEIGDVQDASQDASDDNDDEQDNQEDMEQKLIKILLERKIKSDYLIDGLVVFDNSQGYIMTNVKACCGECNFMKSDYDFDKMIDKCYLIYHWLHWLNETFFVRSKLRLERIEI
jgi:NAD-dependent DNA ligase